jgi:hypothetical protein
MFLTIYQLFSTFIEFIKSFFNTSIHSVISNQQLNIISTIDKYFFDKKDKFIKSFENDSINWNENIINFSHLCSDDLKLQWKSKMLFESTPRGNILLMYDIDKNAFIYHMDSSSASYSLLNAVAMKFVLTFRCRDFFIDENIIPEGYTSPLITAINLKDKIDKDKKNALVQNLTKCIVDVNSPFAKLKSRTIKNVRFDTPDDSIIKIQNKFISHGKINNAFFHQKELTNLNKKPTITTTYKSYKRSWQESTNDSTLPKTVSHSSEFDFSYDIGGIGTETGTGTGTGTASKSFFFD